MTDTSTSAAVASARHRGRGHAGRRPRRAAAPIVCLALALAACQVPNSGSGATPVEGSTELPWSQLRPLVDPGGYVGSTTALLPEPDIAPITTNPHPVLPATVTDNSAFAAGRPSAVPA